MKKLTMILALISTLFLISIASAQCTQIRYWGSFGNEDGQFYGMTDIAVDTSGNIYVAELDNRVQKFSENGEYITQFNIPARGIAIDSAGNIYATVNDSIKKFNSAGDLLNTWGSTGTENGTFRVPVGIALDSSGNIYVSDMNNNRVQKLDPSGKYITSWGTEGSGNGNLKSPAGIAVSGDYVYVADMGNYRIQKFDLDGDYLSSLGSKGTGDTQFNSSIAVETDPAGNIYVADYYNGRVLEYDSNFNYLNQYTEHNYPTALAIANGRLYVLDSGTYQVCEYYKNITANFTSNVTQGPAPLAVQFTDLSENALSLSWDFENDGVSESNESNPVHVFTIPGVYTVNLTASNGECTASKLATITVFTSEPPTANFTANPTKGTVPLTVKFTDTSTNNPDEWFWDFGDGSSSTEQNPSHTYSVPGNYTVRLNVSNAYGSNTLTKPNLINVTGYVTEGLVVYYDGNLSGNSLKDLSENNNIGYAANVIQRTNQATGANYINLNGVDSKIDVSNNAQTSISGPVSIEFIGSINNFTQFGALAGTYNDDGLGWYLSSSAASPFNRARFAAGTSSGTLNCESDASLDAGQGYHIVATYDNNIARIYINGKESGSSTWNLPIIGSPENITIGGYGSSSGGLSYCNCSMYTFRLYNRSLSSDEVLQNYYYDSWKISPNRTIPVITWNAPADITYGTALNETQLNAVATDPETGNTVTGTFVYTPASGTVLGVGTHTLHADFTPADTANYTTASKEVTINVNKSTPVITWSTPADIPYGTALSSTQLNANASVPGTFVYTPAAGTVLSTGTHTLHADFTPADAANYTTASKEVTINVGGSVSPVANFTADPMEGYAPLTVQFTDLSKNATSLSWDFENDGVSDSNESNPIHTYSVAGVYTVNLTASNVNGADSALATITVYPENVSINNEELQLWTFNASEVSDVPSNIYTATYNLGKTSNVSLMYNSTLGSIDSIRWYNDYGETYITGPYPTVNQNLTFTMGVDSDSPWSYGYLHTSVARIGVRHASDGSYEIVSYWMNDTDSQLKTSFQIPASSVINNRVTVSIHSYDSNRTNVITAGPGLSVTTPYTTKTTRELPYANVIQPLIYLNFWANNEDGWVNVHLYNITQSIPRDLITPYARNDIMGFGLDYPNFTNNHNGTDLLISRGQTATVYVSEANLINDDDIAYDNSLFANGFEEGIHFDSGLSSISLEEAKNIIDSKMMEAETAFGSVPSSWSCHQNKDNITHAIYTYDKYGALYRNGPMGMAFIPNVNTLSNSTWHWWSVSSEHGAISPCFTHRTDIYPAIEYSIDPNLFETFVTNLNSNGINLVNFSNWYYSSMAQNADTKILQSDENSIRFQLNTTGGYPVNVNVKTAITPLRVDYNNISIPFEQTSDGIQFRSIGNGTYNLTKVPSVPPVANFTADPVEGFAPLTVQFNDTSSNSPTSWSWEFGDGNTSTDQNPTYTYSVPGNYTVNLTARNDDGSSEPKSIDIIVKRVLAPPVANFTADPVEGFAPLTVQFNDTSSNSPTSWSWEFGDGNTSTDQNPTYTYSVPGNYTVNLTARNDDGSSEPKSIEIVVKRVLAPPVANFTADPVEGFAPLTVQFNDTSSNSPTSWLWEFGDGNTSTDQNPSHKYNSPGTYTVSLNVSNAYGYNISTKPDFITVGSDTSLVRNGLVVYYDGNLSGNSLVDLSGNNNIGYATNVTQGTNQSTGAKYINLNGINSKIDVSNNAQTNISSPVTIEFIGSINNFKRYGAIVSKHNNYVSDWYLACSATSPFNRARFAAATSAGWKFHESDTGLIAGQVYHIVATYDNNTARIYINGKESGYNAWNSPIKGGARNITIGSGYDLNYSNCSMYTFRLYNRSLTQDEVRQNYENDLWRYNGYTHTKATPTITWSNPADITYGTALSSTQLNAIATDPVTGNTVTGTFVYTPAAGTILGVGTHTLHVDFTPADTANYTTTSKEVTINVNKSTPVITWSTPADIPYGTALSSTQLNANASVPGTFVYTPAAGTVLSAGTHTLHVDFTPADTANYTSVSKEVTINVIGSVTQKVPAIIWSNPADITYGAALNSTQLNAIATDPVTGNTIAGSFVYTPAAGTVLGVGTHTLHVDFTPADTANYTTASKEVTINVSGGDLVRNGLVVYYDGNLSGNSLVDLSGNSNIGYATSATQGTSPITGAKYITLNGVNSKIDVSNNAKTNISGPVSIEFIGSINNFKRYGAIVSKHNNYVSDWYLGSSAASPFNRARFAAATSAGWKFHESDTGLIAGQVYHIVATYDNNTARIYINGEESGSSTWNSPIKGGAQNITIGSGYDLNYSNCSMYTFRLYNRSLTQDEVRQNYENDLWRYNGYTHTKATPTITWSNPADITYGTALSSTQLNAKAPVSGRFVYNPASGTVLKAGTHTLQTTFTPANSANYTTATRGISLTVNKATPVITWNPASIPFGTALSSTQLNAVATNPVTGDIVAGTFVYTPAAGTVLSTDTHTLHVDFTPNDVANYTTASKDISINAISQKTIPIITWSNPADIPYGTSLSSTQLNAVATDPVTGNTVTGTFIYTPVAGTVLGVGTHTLHADFTPADTEKYSNVSKDVTINVYSVGSKTPTIIWNNPADISVGTPLSETQLNAIAIDPLTGNRVAGSFVYTPATGTVLSAGTHTLQATFTPTDVTNYTTASSSVSINVVSKTPAKSSSGNKKDSSVKLKILRLNSTQSSNSIENIGKEIKSDSGNKTASEETGKNIKSELGKETIDQHNKLNKGLQTEQEAQNIPGFGIAYGVACLLGALLYKRK